MKKTPTPEQFDALAAEYGQCLSRVAMAYTKAEKEAEPHAARATALKAEIQELVLSQGSAHAEKSKLFHGVKYEAVVTESAVTSIDAAAVEKFRLALVEGGDGSLMRRVFQKTVRWTLASGYGELIRTEKLSKTLLAFYAACHVTKPRAPSLIVREKKV